MSELYAGLTMAWNSQAEHEADFLAHNTLYPLGISATKITAINAAQALPDGEAASNLSEQYRITLIQKNETVIIKWNSLDSYIKIAFPGAQYKPHRQTAGSDLYSQAANYNWDKTKQLLVSAITFITDNSAALTTAGMPASFPTEFAAAQTAFIETYNLFTDARQDAKMQTDAKIIANNAIFTDGRNMMDIAKNIYRANPALRERFIWERILEIVSAPAGGAQTIILEADLILGQNTNIDTSSLGDDIPANISLEATGSALRFYAAPTPTDLPAATFVDLNPGQKLDYTGTAFMAALGFSDTNKYFNVQNIGAFNGHYKITARF